MIKFNSGYNSYPKGMPVYRVVVTSGDSRYWKVGDVLDVMESLNPYFYGKWRVTDSLFIDKDKCKLLT